MIIRKDKRRIKAICDPKTGITYIKICDGDKDKSKLSGKVSYWSTSLLVHDYEEQYDENKYKEIGRTSILKKVMR